MIRSSTVVSVIAAALGIASAGYADVVTDWNGAALDAIRMHKTSPPVASRALAILHASIYDAINGIDRTHEQYLVPSAVPASASKQAAASAAAHAASIALFPASAAAFDDLHAGILASIDSGPSKDKGIAWGEYVAARILELRSNDGFDAIVVVPSGKSPTQSPCASAAWTISLMRAVPWRRPRRTNSGPARSAIHPATGQSSTPLFPPKRLGRTPDTQQTSSHGT